MALALSLGNITTANAETPAISFTSPANEISNYTDLDGWEFFVNNNITVDALGFYNNPAHGITQSHDIGIYNVATQSLVVSGTVSPLDPYSNWFNWISVVPTVLTAGHTYDIVAIVGNDNRTWDPNGLTVDSNITYIRNVWSNPPVSSLSFPVSTDGNQNGYFGPNFKISSSVPEPEMLSMYAIGLLGLGIAIRKKA